ncbi:vacuolar membrane-associated protein iml1 [Friedmanniomyces endolithicus]|nr:vacuolar membrane-associated protein iml1 [Friedmanniomyces endolithicus]
MAIDQLRRSCSVVLHDDRASTEDALCGSDVLPLGILAKLSASGSTPIYILAASAAAQRDEISIHVSLAQRFGFQNRASATVEILETADTVAATATHIEFFFRDQHLSRADMWRIMQRLDVTVAYQGQKVSYLGSLAVEVRAIYVSGKEVSSAYVTHAKTKPIFRSGSARYTIMIQISKEMLEHWVDSELMYERVISGFISELFRKWDALKARHQVTVVLFGRSLKRAEDVQADDFFHVVDSDVSSSDWRRLLRRLKQTFDSPSLPSQVALAAQGNMLQAIHMAAMDFANENVDPHLRSRGTSIIAITAGAGLFETNHESLKSTTHLLMGNSIGVDIVAMSPKPFHPVPLFSYQRDGIWEYALPHWVDISFWDVRAPGPMASWLFPRPSELINVAISSLDMYRGNSTSVVSSQMDDYDDALFRDHALTTREPVKSTRLPNTESTTLTEVSRRILHSTKTESMTPDAPVVDRSIAHLGPPSQTLKTRASRTVLPPHSLMASSRKISLGPKGLAPGRGLASTTLSAAYAQHDRDPVANTPFPPNESASGIAKQIRKSLARKSSQQSMTSHPPVLPVAPSRPINIRPAPPQGTFEDEADLGSTIEDGVTHAVLKAEAADVSETPTAKDDLFYIAMKAAEAEGHWKTSPWLTLLNPCNPTRDNMRVAAQYRNWQHVFPRAVSPTEFKWASMCSPAALPLTTEYAPSIRELQKQFTKKVRRLLVLKSEDPVRFGGTYALSQLIKLRLTYGFQLTISERAQPRFVQSDTHSRVLMSLGNTHHELQRLSNDELQVVEYTLGEAEGVKAAKEVVSDDGYHIRVRNTGYTKTVSADVKLMTPRSEPAWARLDEEVVAHTPSHDDVDATRMRLVLIPVELPRPGHITPGPSRGLSDEERYIEGIQKLTQLWQRNHYITPGDRQHQASLSRPRTTPRVAPRDPNPLAIEYQTRDPSAVAYAYGSAATVPLDGQEQATPLFAESEMYHSSGFDVIKLVKQMQERPPHGVEVRDRRWFARMHFKCFRGDEMVNWLLRVFRDLQTREDAIAIGKDLMERGVFSHVRAKHEFRDGNYFYQIASTHRTTEYPDNASMFGRSSLKSVPSTPVAEPRSSPFTRPLREDGTSSGKPTPKIAPSEKRKLLLSEKMLYNADPGQKSDKLEIISLHYDRIHNPENCYHILLEWVNTTVILVREAVNRWTTLAETHGLRLVQVPCVEASKLHVHHPLEVPIPVNLALRPPESIPMTPVVDGRAVVTPHATARSYAYQKALLRELDFVLDFEAAASFPAKLEVVYSYGKPDYDMTQYIHKSGLLLAQICVDDKCDFLLVPNRLAAIRTSIAGRPLVEAEAVEHIVKRFVTFCQDEKALRTFYEQTKQPPPSPLVGNEYGMDNDVPPIQLPPRLAHRAVMRTVL